MKKNNKICKTKKRPEPEGSWPLNMVSNNNQKHLLFCVILNGKPNKSKLNLFMCS